MGVDVAGEDDGGGSVMNGATAPGVGGDCGVAGKGRRGAAVRLVGSAALGESERSAAAAADLVGAGAPARAAVAAEEEERGPGPRVL